MIDTARSHAMSEPIAMAEAAPQSRPQAVRPVAFARTFDFRRAIWLAPLIAAWILAAVLSQTSAFNAHPDEIYHARAADYYRDHWLPPKFGDADAIPSYSQYGSSYLHDREIVYWLAGKWMKVFGPVIRDTDKGYRLFNLTLFALLILWFARTANGRPLLVPALLSAQIWYVFSYFNGDAFALTVGFFAAYQVAAPTSALNQALSAPTLARTIRGIIVFGVAIALLLLSKRNFYILLPFIAAYTALREFGLRPAIVISLASAVALGWFFKAPNLPVGAYVAVEAILLLLLAFDAARFARDRHVRRCIAVYACSLALGLALFLPRVLYDKLVVENAANAISNATVAAERFAAPHFKPSDMASGQGFPTLHLRARGVSYPDVLYERGFLWKSFKATVGLYGWLTIASPKPYYALVAISLAALLFVLFRDARATKGSAAMQVTIVASAFMVLTILLSSLHSWIDDFEAQGRYFFPILPMMGIAFLSLRKTSAGMAGTTLALFALGSYSFIYTALRLIPTH